MFNSLSSFFETIYKKILGFLWFRRYIIQPIFEKKKENTVIFKNIKASRLAQKAYELHPKIGFFLKNIITYIDSHENVDAYITGGFVRDILDFHKAYDLDIITVNMSISEIKSFLPENSHIQKSDKPGTLKIFFGDANIDIFMHFFNHFDIEKNLQLRDITINAIAIRLSDRKIIDPFNGISDLKNKIIRAVNIENIATDNKKLMRVFAMWVRFSFSMEEDLESILRLKSDFWKQLPEKYVFWTWKHLFFTTKYTDRAFRKMKYLGWIDMHEVNKIMGSLSYFLQTNAFSLNKTENYYTHLFLIFWKINSESWDKFLDIIGYDQYKRKILFKEFHRIKTAIIEENISEILTENTHNSGPFLSEKSIFAVLFVLSKKEYIHPEIISKFSQTLQQIHSHE